MKRLFPIIFLFAVIFFLSIFITIVTLTRLNTSDVLTPLSFTINPTSTPIPTPTPDPLRPINVLLLGYGGGNHEGGALTDTMILAHVRPRDEKIILVTIPRDLWVNLPLKDGSFLPSKINAAYAIGVDHKNYPNKREEFTKRDGGIKLAAYTVSELTGQHVDYTLAVSFDGFLRAVSILEPLTVSVPQTFTDPYYPVDGKEQDNCGLTDDEIKLKTATLSGFLLEREFTCRYEQISYTKGTQQMSADEALKFVRSRHSDSFGGDFNRSLRQTAFLEAVKRRLSSPQIISKFIPLAQTILKSIDTDMTLTLIPNLVQLYQNYGSYKTTTVSLTIDNVLQEDTGPHGQYILIPKTDNLDIQRFITASLEASASAK